jgi:hypothetical protein
MAKCNPMFYWRFSPGQLIWNKMGNYHIYGINAIWTVNFCYRGLHKCLLANDARTFCIWVSIIRNFQMYINYILEI